MTGDARLAPSVVVAWAAAAVLVGLPQLAVWMAIALLALAVCAVVVAARLPSTRPALAPVALVLALTALVAGGVAIGDGARRPAPLMAAIGKTRIVEAEIAGVPTRSTGRGGEQLLLRANLVRLEDAGTAVSARTPVLLILDGDEKGDHPIGTVIRFRGTLREAEAGEDIAYLLYARGRPTMVAGPPWWLAWAGGLRTSFLAVTSDLPGDGGNLLPGLAIGADDGLSQDLSDAMRASSLTHLTAVSGANCTVVVAAVAVLAGLAGLRRGARTAVSAAALLGFVILVTPQPSVLRAAVMAALVLIALWRGRPAGGLPTLCAAVLMLLVVDPWLARDYGFALSALATAGLLLLSGPLTGMLGRVLPSSLAAALAVPIAAQVACQPVLVLLDPHLALVSVPANLLAAPAAPIATLLGLVSCLLAPVLPLVATAVAWLAWLPAAWIAAVARFFSDLPGGRVALPDGALGAGICAVVAVGVLVAARRAEWRSLLVGLAGLVGIVAATTTGTTLGRALTMPADWQVASCDVGQGDASVVRSAGAVALIDTGEDRPLLRACLDRLGIRHLDLLVLTHYDLDHVGAVDEVLGSVSTALVGPSDGPAADAIVAALAAGGAAVQQGNAGQTGVLGGLSWRVLWPRAGAEPGNDASVVLRFEGDGLTSVFLGDLGEEAQRVLAGTDPGQADVVKVAHHGSADQSPELYARLRSPVALISCGIDNTYGHPTERLLGILRTQGSAPFRTDLEGLLLVAPDPAGARVWRDRDPASDPGTTVGGRR